MSIILSEWTKFATLRSSWWTLASVAALPVAVAVLVAATGSLAPTDTVLAGAIGNTVVGMVPAGIVGVLLAVGEQSGGTARLTIAAVPRRWPVLVAKALVAGGLVAAVALAVHALAFAVAARMLADHEPGAAMPALLAVAFVYASVAVTGVAIGTSVRSPAGAVTAVAGLLLLPALLGPLLGRLQWLAGLGPFAAVQKVVLPDSGAAGPGPDGWVTVALVCAAGLASVAAAAWLLDRRDV
jgi:ABC-2 type transport system permease protein